METTQTKTTTTTTTAKTLPLGVVVFRTEPRAVGRKHKQTARSVAARSVPVARPYAVERWSHRNADTGRGTRLAVIQSVRGLNHPALEQHEKNKQKTLVERVHVLSVFV